MLGLFFHETNKADNMNVCFNLFGESNIIFALQRGDALLLPPLLIGVLTVLVTFIMKVYCCPCT